MIIKMAAGMTFAAVLGKINEEVNPEKSNTVCVGAASTKKGDLFIKLRGFLISITLTTIELL